MEWQLAAVLVTVFFGFLVSTMCGVGGSILLTPALALIFPIEMAVAVSAPVMIFHSLSKAIVFVKHIQWTICLFVLLGSIPGIIGGAMLLSSLPVNIIRWVVVIFILFSAFLKFKPIETKGKFKYILILGGGVYGFVSGISGAGGPVKAAVLSKFNISSYSFVGTTAFISLGSACLRTVFYFKTGLFPSNASLIILQLTLVSLSAIGIGYYFQRFVSPAGFLWILRTALFLACVNLLLK
jgi:uncharacterized membrane protein YfcA